MKLLLFLPPETKDSPELRGGGGGEDGASITGSSSFPNAVQLLIWDYLSDPVHAVQESAASALPCLSLSIPLRDGAFRRAIFPLLHARKKQSRLLFLRVLPLCKTFNARALKVEVQGLLRCPYAREDESEISACLAEILYAAYHNLWSVEELLNEGSQGIQDKRKGDENEEEQRKTADGGGELPQGISLHNDADLRKTEEDMLQVFRVLATPRSRKRTQLTAVTEWNRRDWELRLLLLMRRRRIAEEEERTRQAQVLLLSNDGQGTGGKEESVEGSIDTKAECVIESQRGGLHSMTVKLSEGHVAREGNKRRKIMISDTSESLSLLEKRERDSRLSRFLPLDVLLTLHYVSLQFPLAVHHPLPTFPIERQMQAADCLLSQLGDDEQEEEEETAGQSLSENPPSANRDKHAIKTSSKEELASSPEPGCPATSSRREKIFHVDGTSTSQGQWGGSTIRESFAGLEKRYPLVTRKRRSPYMLKGSRESQEGSHFSFLHRRTFLSPTSQASTTGLCPVQTPSSSIPPSSSSAVSSTPLLLERDTWELLHSDVPCRFGVLRQALRSMLPVLAFISSPFFSGNKKRRITSELDALGELLHKDVREASSMAASSSLSRFSSLSSSPSEEERSSNNSPTSPSSSPPSKKRKQGHEDARPQRDGWARQLATESTSRADSTSGTVDLHSKSLVGRPANKPGGVKSLSGGRRDFLAVSKQENRTLGERQEHDEEGCEGLSLPLFPSPSLADSLLLFKLKLERRQARKQWLLLYTQALSHAATAPALSSRETVGEKRVQSSNSRGEKASHVKGKGLSSFFSLSSSTKPLSRSLSAHHTSLLPQPKGTKKADGKKTAIGSLSIHQQALDGGASLKREDVCLASSATSSLLSSIWPRSKTQLSIYPVHSPTSLSCEENRVSPDQSSLFSSASALSLGRGGGTRRRRPSLTKQETGELRRRRQRREREIVQAFLEDGEDFSFPTVSFKRRSASPGEVEDEEAGGSGFLETGGRWVSSWAARLRKEIEQDKESHHQEGSSREESTALPRGCEVRCLSWRQAVNMCLPEESWKNFLLLEKTWEVLRKKWRRKTTKEMPSSSSSSSSSSPTPLKLKRQESSGGNTSPKKTSLFSSFLSVSLHLLSEQQKARQGDLSCYSLLHSSSSSSLCRVTESVLPRSFCLWRNELISSRLQALAATALIFSPSLVLNRYELLPDRRLLSLLPSSSFSHIEGREPLHPPLDLSMSCLSSSTSTSGRDSKVISYSQQGEEEQHQQQQQQAPLPYQVKLEKLFAFLSSSLSYFFVVNLRKAHWRRSLEAYMQEGAVAATGLASLYPIVIRSAAGGESENKNSASRHLDCFYTVKGEKVSSARCLEGRGGLVQEALNDLLPIPVRFGCSKGAVIWLEARLTLPREQLRRMTSECSSFAEKQGEKDEVEEKKKNKTEPVSSNTQHTEETSDTEMSRRGAGVFSRPLGTMKQYTIRAGQREGLGEGQEEDKKEERGKEEAQLCKERGSKQGLLQKSIVRSSLQSSGRGEAPRDDRAVVVCSDLQKAKEGQKLTGVSLLQRSPQIDREHKNDGEKDKGEMGGGGGGGEGEEGDGRMAPTTKTPQLKDRSKTSAKIEEKRSSSSLSPVFYLCVRVPVALELPKKRDGEQQTKAGRMMHGAVSGEEVKGGQQLGQHHLSHNQESLGYFPSTSLMKKRSSPLVRAVLANFYTSVCSTPHSSSLMFSSTSEAKQGVSHIGSPPSPGILRPSSPSLTPSSSGGPFKTQATPSPGEKKEESHSVVGSAPTAPSSPVPALKDRHSRWSGHRRKRKTPSNPHHGKLGGTSGGCGFASRILGLHLKKSRSLVKNILSFISTSESPSTGIHSSSSSTAPLCLESPRRTSCSTDISAFPSSSLDCFSSSMDSPELSFPPRTRLKPSVVPLFSPGAELGNNCLHNASEKGRNSLLRRSQRREYGSQGDYPCGYGRLRQEDKESGVSLYRIDLDGDESMEGDEGPWLHRKDKIEVRVTFPLSLDAPTSGPFPGEFLGVGVVRVLASFDVILH